MLELDSATMERVISQVYPGNHRLSRQPGSKIETGERITIPIDTFDPNFIDAEDKSRNESAYTFLIPQAITAALSGARSYLSGLLPDKKEDEEDEVVKDLLKYALKASGQQFEEYERSRERGESVPWPVYRLTDDNCNLAVRVPEVPTKTEGRTTGVVVHTVLELLPPN